ncbi:GIY-YIG nuclease family protein [Aestuariivivens sediminicola]|uniref:GIY-YIG nuclease family protein n=1 Tax=Aestuariivivens sediminicola TaxID=2913560 RepID=UPI001F572334|nr:GIY-YIG nuclease family protein [Aestuariivivens sediminicola]
MEYKVYVLYSERLNQYYVGQTGNIEKRLKVHNKGGNKYTTRGMPWKLIDAYSCSNRSEAVRLERKIKKRGIKRYLDEN